MTKTQKDIRTEVLIIGGGLAGLSLAGVLGAAGVEVVIVDREAPLTQQKTGYDGRTTAVSFASHRVLQAAEIWDDILPHACPILDIRVADGNSPLFLHFGAEADGNGAPFGWIVENNILRRLLSENLKKFKNVQYLAPATVREFRRDAASAGVTLENGACISAPLMVGADGRNSSVRTWLDIEAHFGGYDQSAIVCNVAHEIDHENVAVEHFLPAGPFAILPMTDDAEGRHRSSVVWTVESGDAQAILQYAPEKFDAELQKLFGPHLGDVRHVSKPMSYPLSLLHARSYTADRVALMAEAAHVIHPIAGQGLNLSMRDVAVLSELAFDRLRIGLDIGAPGLLSDYEQLRRTDTLLMAGFTDILNRLFSNEKKSIGMVRDLGLGIVEKIDPLKRFFARQAMGLGGRTPRIMRDGSL